uniref:Transposase Tc1-like domain-containing protein n=1 Tax=Salarias fasciatus TaxID=181472 RepID=A0A672F5P9_SALFA
MGKSRDLSEFERGTIVGARRAGCSITQTANLLAFSRTAVSRVYREWCDKQKTSSQRKGCGRKRLVDESGERRMERMVEENNRATCTQIQALYNRSEPDRPISLTTTRRALRRLGYSRSTPQQDALIAAGLEALAAFTSSPGENQTEPESQGSTDNEENPQT